MGLCCSSNTVALNNIINSSKTPCPHCSPDINIQLNSSIKKPSGPCPKCINNNKQQNPNKQSLKENNFLLSSNFSFQAREKQNADKKLEISGKSYINSINFNDESTIKNTPVDSSLLQHRSLINKTEKSFDRTVDSKENYRYDICESLNNSPEFIRLNGNDGNNEKIFSIKRRNSLLSNSSSEHDCLDSKVNESGLIILKPKNNEVILFCPMNHKLRFSNKGGICFKCRKTLDSKGLICKICSLFYCINCSGVKIDCEKCFCGEYLLSISTSTKQCDECGQIEKYVKSCKECDSYFCSKCLDLKIDSNNCLCGKQMNLQKNTKRCECFNCKRIRTYVYFCDSCLISSCFICSKVEISKNNCFLGHNLIPILKKIKCFSCRKLSNYGKYCRECDFELCCDCSDLKFSKNLCFCLRELDYVSNSKSVCLKCNINYGFGKGCSECEVYICYKCCEMEITHNKCLGNHDLIQRYSFQDFRCLSCLKFENFGNFCDKCLFFLCANCTSLLQNV